MDFSFVRAVVPICADVFRVRDGGDRALWRAARRDEGSVATVAMPSVCEGRIGSCRKVMSDHSHDPGATVIRSITIDSARTVNSEPRTASDCIGRISKPPTRTRHGAQTASGLCADVPGHHAVSAVAEEVHAAAAGESANLATVSSEPASFPAAARDTANRQHGRICFETSRPTAHRRRMCRAAPSTTEAASESETVIENDRLPHRLHQSRCAGEVVGAEEVGRRKWQAPRSGEPRRRREIWLSVVALDLPRESRRQANSALYD